MFNLAFIVWFVCVQFSSFLRKKTDLKQDVQLILLIENEKLIKISSVGCRFPWKIESIKQACYNELML